MSDDQKTTRDGHPRGSSWCCPTNLDRIETEAPRCWCGDAIVNGVGQCGECQEDAGKPRVARSAQVERWLKNGGSEQLASAVGGAMTKNRSLRPKF